MEENNINKRTSRKNDGAAENNRDQVRGIVEHAIYLGDGAYVVEDMEDNKIYVDTVRGRTGLIVPTVDLDGTKHNSIVWYADGSNSSKKNGYVYTPIVVVDTYGLLTTKMYATHSLVCMLSDRAGYDALDKEGITPVCNHMNNRSWDNRADNLEWTSYGGNARHGKIVASMIRHFGCDYGRIEHNLSDTDFMVLYQKLSVKDIEDYMEHVDNKYEFKCANNEYINEDVIGAFVDWLFKEWRWVCI